MNRTNAGFTLLELLAGMAILAALLVVLLPQLLSARGSAEDVVAGLFSSHVAKASHAWLALDAAAKASDLAGDCQAHRVLTGPSGETLGWDSSPPSVDACVISANDQTGQVNVRVTSLSGKVFMNGVREDRE